MEVTGFDSRQFGTHVWYDIINNGIIIPYLPGDSEETITHYVADAIDRLRRRDLYWLNAYRDVLEYLYPLFWDEDNELINPKTN
jgi:hypothetical protein